jgi:hypothetical protein
MYIKCNRCSRVGLCEPGKPIDWNPKIKGSVLVTDTAWERCDYCTFAIRNEQLSDFYSSLLIAVATDYPDKIGAALHDR